MHGIFGNYTDWVTGTNIHAWAQEKNLVVIMPSGENKFYVDCEATGERYGEFIGKELVQVTRDLFHLSDQREDTYIAGLSMGGYGAIVNGLKYNEVFGCIAGLSSGFILDFILASTNDGLLPTMNRRYYETLFGDLNMLIGSDKDYKALLLSLKEKQAVMPMIYLACGTEDILIAQNRDYRDFMVDHNIQVTYEEGSGGHDWNFWNTYIKKVLDWLPLEKGAEGVHSGNVKI